MNKKHELLIADNGFSSSLVARNKLLAQWLATPDAGEYLIPQFRVVSLERNQVLYEQGDTIEYVYFPIDAVVSSLAIMEDGTTMETSMVGPEGLVGVSAILGSGISRQWLWVLVSGTALQLEAKLLDRLCLHNEVALKSLLRFYRSMITQVSQRCVCNTRHTVMDRLCCWLLMLDDRIGGENLRLTQEMIASRLGARRAGITVAAGTLQAMQGIEYRRGQLHITDREVLEGVVCECYEIMSGDYRFPPPQRRRLSRPYP
ncbi:MAG TPA: Crp/Fnr family transcriptional regulator [Pyrinomonadaceae bacterium]|nr:Crp/Fnr family transcriptional regulator [Pyrinomonadaceae bacterium]